MISAKSIKTRLVWGLMVIVLFFLGQAGLIWFAIDNARTSIVDSVHKNTVATGELGSLAVLAQQVRRYEKEYFVWVGNPEKRASYEREWRDAIGKIDSVMVNMMGGSKGAFVAKDIEQIAEWRDAAAFYAAEMDKIFRGVSLQPDGAVRPDEVNDLIKAGKDRLSKVLIKGVSAMSEAKAAETLALAGSTDRMFDNIQAGVMVTVVIGLIVASILSLGLPEMVSNAIAQFSEAAQEMSKGNLQREFDAGGVAEFVSLAEALNRMRVAQIVLVERLQKRRRDS